MPKNLDQDYQLDLNAVGQILNEELAGFKRHIYGWPISEESDLRAFFIAWVAIFLPEAVTKPFLNQLKTFVQIVEESPDYSTSHWSKILPLQVGLYALTNDFQWLNNCRGNIDHGKQSLRKFTTETLALVANRISFHDSELIDRIERNIEIRHFFWEWGVVILIVADGDSRAKIELLQKWLKKYRKNEEATQLINKLIQGHFIHNEFLDKFLWIQQYVSLRLICKQPVKPEQLTFLEENVIKEKPLKPSRKKNQQKELFRLERESIDREPTLINKLWERMREHPLTASLVNLDLPRDTK